MKKFTRLTGLPFIPPLPFEEYLRLSVGVRNHIAALTTALEQAISLILTLQADLDALRDQINSNSSNSNRPPSSDPPFSKPSSKKSSKKKDGDTAPEKDDGTSPQRKAHHPGATQAILPPTNEIETSLTTCPVCGGHEFKNKKEYIHQHVELRDNPLDVTHVHVQTGRCVHCGQAVSAPVPPQWQGAYGQRLEALITYLDSRTGVTRRQLQEFCQDILEISISQGGLQNILDRASRAILPYYNAIAESVRKSWFNHFDETSWRTHGPTLGKNLHWLWVMTNPILAFFKVHTHRSEEAFRNMINDWDGLLISDDYGVYRKWGNERQTCLAHITREARKIAESQNPEEAACGKSVQATLRTLTNMDENPPTEGQKRSLKGKITIIFKKFSELGGRAGNLAKRLKSEFACLMAFLSHPLIEKTNNHAERQIRAAVCTRKISIGSAAEKGERFIERTLSLRKTCELNRLSYYSMLHEAINSYRKGVKPNLLWIRKLGWRSFHSKDYPFLLQKPFCLPT